MDCDTTGIEPDIALVKYKLLAGGGMLKIVNQTVKPALEKLSYNSEEVERIVAHIDTFDTIEDVESSACVPLANENAARVSPANASNDATETVALHRSASNPNIFRSSIAAFKRSKASAALITWPICG